MLFNMLYNKIVNNQHNHNIITKVMLGTILIVFIIGQILNIVSSHHLFYINQALLLVMLIIQIFVLKRIRKEKEEIKINIAERHEPEVSGLFNGRIQKISYSFIGEITSFILVIFYIVTMFILECLEVTITGIYGGVLGALVFYIGIQAYIHYISLLYFAYALRHIEIKNYSFYFPAITKWIRQLAGTFSYIEKWFLLLGLMYSSIYAINLPRDIVMINPSLSLQSNSNILLIITWIGIILLFVIAFPTFTFLSRSFLKSVIYNCKYNSINKIEQLLIINTQQETEESLSRIERYLSIIKAISESDDYPLKYSHTIFDSTYAIMFATITLFSPFLPLVEEFIFKS